ncbi:MAG: hypothetical protein H6Q78_1693 [Candidatus Krumholzibacteriota bacterium]|nr:hypothetical protein [Candidatus Krumholzibacteriota bacterium]
MSLEGNLSSFGIAEILQLIAVQQKSGLLSVTRQSSSMKFFFRGGKIISTRDRRRGAPDPLKDYFARYGVLSREELARLTEISAQSRLDFTDVAVSEGVLSEEELERHCRNHIQEAVYEVLGWEHCSYKFIAAPEAAAGVKALTDAGVEGLLMESMRRIDEFPLILKEFPDGAISIRRRADEGAPANLSPQEKAVMELLTVERTIDDIIPRAKYPRFDTYEALKLLKEKNLIDVSQPVHPASAGEKKPAEGKPSRSRTSRNPFPLVAAGLAFIACALWGARDVLPFFDRGVGVAAGSASAGSTRDRNRLEEEIRWHLEVYRAMNGDYPSELSALDGLDTAPESLSQRASAFSFRYYLTPGGDRYILL